MNSFQQKLDSVGWYQPLKEIWNGPELAKLMVDIQLIRSKSIVYPESKNVLNALFLTPFDKVRVVILGQDPYYNAGQANGLAFAVNKGNKIPPSLKNIFKEIEFDLQVDMTCKSPDLTGWAQQGVLLLNTTLTVEDGKPGSHAKLGWHVLTDGIIKALSTKTCKKTFMLWGNHAIQREGLIELNQYNQILKSAHPSPLSVKGFYGNNHFSRCNIFLNNCIDWSITSYQEDSLYEIIGL